METPIPSNINPKQPTAADVAASLKAQEASGKDPFSFLETVLNQPVQNTPVEVLNEVTKKREEERAVEGAADTGSVNTEDREPEPQKDLGNPGLAESPGSEEDTGGDAEPVGDPQDEVVAEALSEQTSKEINFKKVRKEFHETKKTLKEREEELKATKEKLQKYESGEDFPEIIKEKDRKIAELSKYEKAVALKTSDAYKEKYVKPIQAAKAKLKTIAEDYGLPPEKLGEVLNIKSARELNSFLSEHFDPVGAIEVKQLIGAIKETETQAQEAEKEPEEALKSIEQEYSELKQAERAKDVENIIKKSKGAWVKSVNQIRQEGKIKEFIPSDVDDDWNDKVVAPISEKAGQEYGKLMRVLAESGAKDIPEDAQFAIARMVQIAIASSFALQDRDRAEAEAAEIRANAARTHGYIRPRVGGGNSSGQSPSSRGPSNPNEAADMAIAAAMGQTSKK